MLAQAAVLRVVQLSSVLWENGVLLHHSQKLYDFSRVTTPHYKLIRMCATYRAA